MASQGRREGEREPLEFYELVTYDPHDYDTYPSVCNMPEEVEVRFGFSGGETLLFDAQGSYVGQVIKRLGIGVDLG